MSFNLVYNTNPRVYKSECTATQKIRIQLHKRTSNFYRIRNRYSMSPMANVLEQKVSLKKKTSVPFLQFIPNVTETGNHITDTVFNLKASYHKQ